MKYGGEKVILELVLGSNEFLISSSPHTLCSKSYAFEMVFLTKHFVILSSLPLPVSEVHVAWAPLWNSHVNHRSHGYPANWHSMQSAINMGNSEFSVAGVFFSHEFQCTCSVVKSLLVCPLFYASYVQYDSRHEKWQVFKIKPSQKQRTIRVQEIVCSCF